MLDAAVERKIEDRVLAEDGGVEIAGVNQEFVVLGLRLHDDLAIRIDDQAAADQGVAILDAGLRHTTTQVEFWYAPACTERRLWNSRFSGPSSLFSALTDGVL